MYEVLNGIGTLLFVSAPFILFLLIVIALIKFIFKK